MAYSTGILNKRITVQERTQAVTSKWGMDGAGITYTDTATLWANVEWARGKAAMIAGALDAYTVIMVRIRWTDKINMRCRVVYEGDTYQIVPETYHVDRENNTIQFHAQLIINDGETGSDNSL